jgi:hypothetical protein
MVLSGGKLPLENARAQAAREQRVVTPLQRLFYRTDSGLM